MNTEEIKEQINNDGDRQKKPRMGDKKKKGRIKKKEKKKMKYFLKQQP